MSAEIFSASRVRSSSRDKRRNGWRLSLLALVFVFVVGGVVFAARTLPRRGLMAAALNAPDTAASEIPVITLTSPSWKIQGALSETCTCNVPCTCNFGQGPSPHSYCYPFYSYEIRKGNYGDIALDGLHFGSADLQSGHHIFIDERADERQRAALRLIVARVIGNASDKDLEKKAKEIAPQIRYTAVKQDYDARRNHLAVAGFGEFAADYIMGLDSNEPLVVRNNTTWRIRDAIKAKTSVYRVKVGQDAIDTKATNSNQGDFEYTDKTDFDGSANWNCAACAMKTEKGKSEQGDCSMMKGQ
jgi:hypothetical protein